MPLHLKKPSAQQVKDLRSFIKVQVEIQEESGLEEPTSSTSRPLRSENCGHHSHPCPPLRLYHQKIDFRTPAPACYAPRPDTLSRSAPNVSLR
ncbi:hypothetical protein MTO96_021800 [Rhipicephalus appendiculatus]